MSFDFTHLCSGLVELCIEDAPETHLDILIRCFLVYVDYKSQDTKLDFYLEAVVSAGSKERAIMGIITAILEKVLEFSDLFKVRVQNYHLILLWVFSSTQKKVPSTIMPSPSTLI